MDACRQEQMAETVDDVFCLKDDVDESSRQDECSVELSVESVSVEPQPRASSSELDASRTGGTH